VGVYTEVFGCDGSVLTEAAFGVVSFFGFSLASKMCFKRCIPCEWLTIVLLFPAVRAELNVEKSATMTAHYLLTRLPVMISFLRLAIPGSLLCIALLSCSREPEQIVEFDVETADGRFFSADYKDKVVYLDFWATWCTPCRESFPWMNEMREKYQSEGLQIIAVSIDADKALARQFATELGASFDVGYDPDGKVADMFDVNAMPTSVILSKGGQLFDVHKGFNEEKKADFEKAIVSALKTLH